VNASSKLRIHGSRIAVSLLVVIVTGAVCAAAFALGSSGLGAGTLGMASSSGGAVAGGTLSLRSATLAPGDTVRGTAVVRNDGDAPGRFYLHAEGSGDRPGSGGSGLSETLAVTVTDVTTAGHPLHVFAGPPAGLSGVDLGTFAPRAERTYRIVVSLPASVADAAAGGSLELGLQWTAVTVQ